MINDRRAIIQDRLKIVFQYIGWLLVFLAIVYAGLVAIFYNGQKAHTKQEVEVQKLVKRTAITNIDKYYHLNRGIKSYSVEGSRKNGKKAYFVYLPKRKKAYYYTADQGVSESQVKSQFQKSYPKKNIKEINLGWYNKQAVWEVSAKNKNGTYCYGLYTFKNGKELTFIDNL